MKELKKGTVISILLHGVMLGGFLWMTRDASLTTAMGGEEAPAGDIQFANNSPISKPIDVSDLVVPPQPVTPPEAPEEQPDAPTPVANVEPEAKETPDGPPILEKQKEPIKPKQPPTKKNTAPPKQKTPKKPVTASTKTTPAPRALTREERMAAIRGNLDKSRAKKGNSKLIALAGNAGASGMPTTDASTIGAGLSKGVRNETLKLGGIGVGGNGLGGKGGGDTDGTGTPEGDRYAGALQGALYRAWQQPSGNEINGKPTVNVKFTIQSNGVIAGKSIVRGSRSSAMDASINTMLRKLTRVPAPANYGVKASSVTLTVTFELD